MRLVMKCKDTVCNLRIDAAEKVDDVIFAYKCPKGSMAATEFVGMFDLGSVDFLALPFWAWMARRICAQYERTATMASLFDGIGGFPLCFQRSGAVPVWASEIEEFPIAVTKIRFPEEEHGN